MKVILLILALLLSDQVSATEIYLGYGVPYRADSIDSDITSFSIERNKWKVDYSHWESYNRSSWDVKKHPTWQPFLIKDHRTLSVARNIYQYDFKNKCNLYLDFGLAYSTRISRTTSSYFLFHEALGYQCGWWRLEINHRSNAGLKGKNTGEDGIYFKFLLWTDD